MFGSPQANTDQIDIVQCRNDREREGRSQKSFFCDPHPLSVFHLKKHHENHGGQLGKSVGFAEDAGAEIAQSDNGIKQSADQHNADVAAEYHHRVFPGNLVQNRKHHKNGAQQHFVGDGVEILAEQSLLMKPTGQQAVKTVAQTSEHEQKKRPAVTILKHFNNDERQERQPDQGELVGSSQDLRKLKRSVPGRIF